MVYALGTGLVTVAFLIGLIVYVVRLSPDA